MSWEFVDNPAYAGAQTARPLTASCHDGSPFITIRCDCGFDMHQHESRIAAVPADTAIGMPCQGCGKLLIFAPGQLEDAFAQMRADGWID